MGPGLGRLPYAHCKSCTNCYVGVNYSPSRCAPEKHPAPWMISELLGHYGCRDAVRGCQAPRRPGEEEE